MKVVVSALAEGLDHGGSIDTAGPAKWACTPEVSPVDVAVEALEQLQDGSWKAIDDVKG